MLKLIKEFGVAIWEVFKLPFFLIAEGFRRLYAFGWRKLVMLFVAAIILTVVVGFSFLEMTSQPQFCSSCHLMEPYIAAWKTSSHADVACMECHARAGIGGFFETKFTALSMLVNYATGLYKRSKPWAEIEDEACLKCHETRLLEGKIEMDIGVHFDHTPHLTEVRRGRKLRCTSCHSQIVQGEHISITPTTCFLCHFKNLDEAGRAQLSACTKCHTPPTGEHAKERGVYDHTAIVEGGVACESCHQQMWQGEGKVSKERCGACHSKTAHIDRINDIEFIHEWHIEKRKVDCGQCHDVIEHQQPSLDNIVRNECSSCHEDPHAPMLAVYRGEGSRLVKEKMPDVMYNAGVACYSCHKDPLTGKGKARIGKDACTPCHNASYFNLATSWRAGLEKRINALQSQLKGATGDPRIEDARHDLALLRTGGVWHNPDWASKVLDEVQIVLAKAGHGTPPTSLPDGDSKCLACHSGIEAASLNLQFSAFNHTAHLTNRGITCTQCHADTKPEDSAHGELKDAGNSCLACHHGSEVANEANNCTPCHEPSRRNYFGRLPGFDTTPSPMADSDMACGDCHLADAGYKAPDKDFCLDCHEPDIVDGLDFTRGKLRSLINKLGKSATPAQEIIRLDRGRAVHNPGLDETVMGNEK